MLKKHVLDVNSPVVVVVLDVYQQFTLRILRNSSTWSLVLDKDQFE